MKNKKTLLILLIIIIAITVIVSIVIKINTGDENSPDNTSENFASENSSEVAIDSTEEQATRAEYTSEVVVSEEVEGFDFKNKQIILQDDKRVLLADVTNNTGSDVEETSVEITFYDKDGNVAKKVNGTIPALKAGATAEFQTEGFSTDFDLYYYDIDVIN